MKKLILLFINILLIKTAFANQNYNSSLYFPKKSETLSKTMLQYNNGNNDMYRFSHFTIRENAKIGLTDQLSLNLDFTYDYRFYIKNDGKNTTYSKLKLDNSFNNVTIGMQKRTTELPFILDLGVNLVFSEFDERDISQSFSTERDYINLYLNTGKRFGIYDLGVEIGSKYYFRTKTVNVAAGIENIEKNKTSADYYIEIKNSFSITEYLYLNLNLGYAFLDEKFAGSDYKINSSNLFYYNTELNYNIPDTTAQIGFYFKEKLYNDFGVREYTSNTISTVKSLRKFEYGIKIAAKF